MGKIIKMFKRRVCPIDDKRSLGCQVWRARAAILRARNANEWEWVLLEGLCHRLNGMAGDDLQQYMDKIAYAYLARADADAFEQKEGG